MSARNEPRQPADTVQGVAAGTSTRRREASWPTPLEVATAVCVAGLRRDRDIWLFTRVYEELTERIAAASVGDAERFDNARARVDVLDAIRCGLAHRRARTVWWF